LADEVEARRMDDKAEAKQLDKDTEAQRKEKELLKQKQSQEFSKTPNTRSMPNLSIINIPPQDYTPINAIPGDSSFSSQALNFEGTVVAIKYYYYDEKIKIIEKISNKRKTGEATKYKSYAGRIVEWKDGPDP
jgi:hypothetical protein